MFTAIAQRFWRDVYDTCLTTLHTIFIVMCVDLYLRKTNFSSHFCCVQTCYCKYGICCDILWTGFLPRLLTHWYSCVWWYQSVWWLFALIIISLIWVKWFGVCLNWLCLLTNLHFQRFDDPNLLQVPLMLCRRCQEIYFALTIKPW